PWRAAVPAGVRGCPLSAPRTPPRLWCLRQARCDFLRAQSLADPGAVTVHPGTLRATSWRMKLAHLRKLPDASQPEGTVRGTEAQDRALQGETTHWQRYRMRYALAGGALIVLLFGLLIRGWLHTGAVMSHERLRFAEVTRGHFVRDVA